MNVAVVKTGPGVTCPAARASMSWDSRIPSSCPGRCDSTATIPAPSKDGELVEAPHRREQGGDAEAPQKPGGRRGRPGGLPGRHGGGPRLS